MMTLTEALRRINKPDDELTRMRKFISSNYPATLKALRMIDTENMKPKRGKGFTLVKRESRKPRFSVLRPLLPRRKDDPQQMEHAGK